MNNSRNLFIWFVVIMCMVAIGNAINKSGLAGNRVTPIEYSEFLDNLHEGRVHSAELGGNAFNGYTIIWSDGELRTHKTDAPGNDAGLWGDLERSGISYKFIPAEKESGGLMGMIMSLWPILFIVGIWFLFTRMQGGGKDGGGGGGGRNPFQFGKSRARLLSHSSIHTTFKDVAGCDEAKESVMEIVEFLREPAKFQKLGGKIPRGLLMVGAPGTGKTLLAKAIAGEARVPFFTISGSDFVEMFVGVGASRVRDMFSEAKKQSPCIIFIDEIDAVGRSRGGGLGGANDEREQTLNQLLVEMDGFDTSPIPVIVIAATNRPDVLDAALLRPGRFDRQVVVPLPDVRGRAHILLVHMRHIPYTPNVSVEILARGTPGFSGADLANLVNEAALFAARQNKTVVDMDDFEKAKDKIMMGAERRGVVMPEKERMNTAYHESGHAVVARAIALINPDLADPVYKVTIIPRGRALGLTMQLPIGDRFTDDRERLRAMLAILFGGRIAEEIFMGQTTTGAANDFTRATDIARRMVTEWGMADKKYKLGYMVYTEGKNGPFGNYSPSQKIHSEKTQQCIDAAIQGLLDEGRQQAEKIIESHRAEIERMTQALLEWETLDEKQIDDIMHGREPTAPPPLIAPVEEIIEGDKQGEADAEDLEQNPAQDTKSKDE